MRGHSWLRLAIGSVGISASIWLSGCGGGSAGTATRSLDDVLRSIANSQEVDVALVETAVAERATTVEDQLRVAQQWENNMPERPLPELQTTWEELSNYAAEQLRSSTCEAIVDTVQTHQVPDGQQFFDDYIDNLATGRLPDANERAIMAEFDQLNAEAEAGTLTSTDIQFSLMQLRYC